MPFITQGKTNWKFLLIVIVLVLIIGGGILVYQYLWLLEPELVIPPIQFPTDETADWNIYNNNIFGYKIKYPNNVFINIPSSFSEDASFEIIPIATTKETAITIEIGQNPERLSLLNWIEQAPDGVSYWIKEHKDTIKEVEIANKECIQVTSVTSITNLKTVPISQRIYTLIPFDNRVAVISKVEEDKNYNLGQVYQKMLPTFEFVEIEKIIDWQTYKNEKYGFEIKHPSTFNFQEKQDDLFNVEFLDIGLTLKVEKKPENFSDLENYLTNLAKEENNNCYAEWGDDKVYCYSVESQNFGDKETFVLVWRALPGGNGAAMGATCVDIYFENDDYLFIIPYCYSSVLLQDDFGDMQSKAAYNTIQQMLSTFKFLD